MVRCYEDLPFVKAAEPAEQGANHMFVNLLDGVHFGARVTQVAGFVGCLDVDNDQIERVQCRHGGRPLACIICVEEPGSPGHIE